jgi:hypothetical protein
MEAQGVLYVRQKQWAVTYPGDTLDNGDKAGEDNYCNANTRKRMRIHTVRKNQFVCS